MLTERLIPCRGSVALGCSVVVDRRHAPEADRTAGAEFRAPLRLNSDTQWMNERLLEASYRARFEAGRLGREQLEALYEDMTNSFDPRQNAVLVGAARPRSQNPTPKRRKQPEIAALTTDAQGNAWHWLGQDNYQPLTDVTGYGARGATRLDRAANEKISWRRARAAIFDDGAVGLAWQAGGHHYGADGASLPARHVPADGDFLCPAARTHPISRLIGGANAVPTGRVGSRSGTHRNSGCANDHTGQARHRLPQHRLRVRWRFVGDAVSRTRGRRCASRAGLVRADPPPGA